MEKGFYDILTIIYFILIVVSFAVFMFMAPKANSADVLADMAKLSLYSSIAKIFGSIISFIYWIFILLLAINLKRPVISLILIIIFVPLAPLYYLFSLRKLIPNDSMQIQ